MVKDSWGFELTHPRIRIKVDHPLGGFGDLHHDVMRHAGIARVGGRLTHKFHNDITAARRRLNCRSRRCRRLRNHTEECGDAAKS